MPSDHSSTVSTEHFARTETVMGKRKFDDDQITGILKEHQAGVTVADVCHKHGISEPTSIGGNPCSTEMSVSMPKG